MKKLEFRSHKGDYCALTDEYVIYADSKLSEARVFPLGCVKKLTAKAGLKLVTNSGESFFLSFLHMKKKIKNRVKTFVKEINETKDSAPKEGPYSIEIEDTKRQSIAQIRIPHLSKKKAIKSIIILTFIVVSLIALVYIMYLLGKTPENDNGFLPNGSEITNIWETIW